MRCMRSSEPLVDGNLEQVKEETVNDPILQEVMLYAQSTWPGKETVSAGVQKYYQFKDELYVQDGMVLRGHRLVIPFALRQEMLSRIHEGHQGIVKCSRRAREAVWWPGASKDIQQLIEGCEICLKEKDKQHQPLKPTKLPEKPWQELGSDLFEFQGKIYLLIVDYYSRWIEIYQLREMTSRSVIVKLKNAFARFGIPLKFRSDNGACYSSELFRNFSETFGFQHITSSPRYPESNGLAERSVKTIKRLWKKSEDFHQSLMIYRATPLESGFSPAELLLGRNIRTTLPKLKECDKQLFVPKDQHLKDRQKRNFDRRTRAKDLKEINPNERVWVKTNDKDGMEGFVIRAAEEPDSYMVQRQGSIVRRNRKHLTTLPEQGENRDNLIPVSSEESSIEHANSDNTEETPETCSPTLTQENLQRTRYGRISKPNSKYRDYIK